MFRSPMQQRAIIDIRFTYFILYHASLSLGFLITLRQLIYSIGKKRIAIQLHIKKNELRQYIYAIKITQLRIYLA